MYSYPKNDLTCCDEELDSSIASLSPHLFHESGTLEFLHNSEPINLEIICSPEPTIEIKPSSSNASFVSAQPDSFTLETHHSPTPPPNNFHITNDNATYTIPTKKKYNTLQDPVLIDSGILTSVLHAEKIPLKQTL